MTAGLLRGVALGLLALFLAGCGTAPFEERDSAPDTRLDPSLIKDAVPRADPVTRAGNKSPYTVLGETYHLLDSAAGYQQRGVASWYGRKFHGRPTANGERYSLYAMTAAHRSLPIPCYVRVTNLENGRSAVVRVNDRGPFHSERIIDLSYAAAVKLGYADKGTALVEVEWIDVDNGDNVEAETETTAEGSGSRHFVQAGAFRSRTLADNLRQRLSEVVTHPVSIDAGSDPALYRVRIGPLSSRNAAERLRSHLLADHLADAQIVSE